MRYTVTIMEHTDGGDDHARSTWHLFTNRTLEEAWRICDRHARRGFNRFGGTIKHDNWGSRGGTFPDAYRSATIRLDA